MIPAKTCTQRKMRLSHSLRVGLIILRIHFLAVRWQSEATTPLWIKTRTAGGWTSGGANPKRRRRFALPAHCLQRSYLTSAISGKAERIEQQRHVVVLCRIIYSESDRNLRVKALGSQR